ncbi:MAG: 3-hydroxyacyl-ACP dehydratase [Bacteroidetes bacterium]|nr:3-hydroxyacyl-ACP dehydratase [Bacteroidota bacterium]
MLKGKLYNVIAKELIQEGTEMAKVQKVAISIVLDGSNAIFGGHFPGNPVLPGVCQVGMVREVAEEILGCRLLLSKASQVKYLSLISPLENPSLTLNLKLVDSGQDEYDVSADITAGNIIFMKMKCRLTEVKFPG